MFYWRQVKAKQSFNVGRLMQPLHASSVHMRQDGEQYGLGKHTIDRNSEHSYNSSNNSRINHCHHNFDSYHHHHHSHNVIYSCSPILRFQAGPALYQSCRPSEHEATYKDETAAQ